MFPFEKLEAWHHCHTLTLAMYQVTCDWPKTETYGLIAQARRAAVSAELNIAEGVAKRGHAEFRRFLDISLGSLSEVACLLRIASDLGYASEAQLQRIEPLRESASKVTWRLYESVAKQTRHQKRGTPPDRPSD